MKKVSIITPCYNGEKFLSRYVKMILAQTYKNLELIFINDGSEDDTERVINSYRKEFLNKGIEFIYLFQKHAGQAVALNKGLNLFTGDYLIYPDIDDILLPESIEKRVKFLEAHPDYGLVASRGWDAYEENLTELFLLEPRQDREVENLYWEIIKNSWTTFPCLYMFRAKAFFKSNPKRVIYENPLFTLQDVQMLLPIAYFFKCGFLEVPLYIRVLSKGSHSRQNDSYVQKLLKNDVIEDVFIKTIESINMSAFEKKKSLVHIRERFLRFRKYLLNNYLLETNSINILFSLKKYLKNKTFIIWGTGYETRAFLKLVKIQKVLPEFFLDNDEKKHGKKLDGIEIKSLYEIETNKDRYWILILTSRYSNLIKQQLLNKNFQEYIHFIAYEDFIFAKY